jgi:hypothetical protein
VSNDGSGEFKLLDDTKLALGPGARLTLDKFVYDASKGDNAIALRFAKGAFRFITGLAEKKAYVIHVPSASITVRGTIFDVFVEDSGTSWLLLHEGAVRVCNATGTCRDHSEAGKLIKISEDGVLSKPTKWAALPGVERISFDSAFPFVVTPPSLDPTPIFTREAILKTTSDTIKSDTVTEPPRRKAETPVRKRKAQTTATAEETPSSTYVPKKLTKGKAERVTGTGKAVQATKFGDKAKLKEAKLKEAALKEASLKNKAKPDRYTQERDRGLDIASKYAPKAIDRIRKDRTIERADSADPSGSAGGWRKIADTYYKPR